MDDLIAGYRRFRASTWQTERSRFEALSRLGQRPRALIIACSDSRTDPQMVFNARPGELFVIRNVANIVPPYGPDDHPHGVSSAIEFAVRSLKVREIVVLGHAMCGGIQALLNGAPREVSDFVGQWVSIAEPAREIALKAPPELQQQVCEHEAVRPFARQSLDLSLGSRTQSTPVIFRFMAAFSTSAPACSSGSTRPANFGQFPIKNLL